MSRNKNITPIMGEKTNNHMHVFAKVTQMMLRLKVWNINNTWLSMISNLQCALDCEFSDNNLRSDYKNKKTKNDCQTCIFHFDSFFLFCLPCSCDLKVVDTLIKKYIRTICQWVYWWRLALILYVTCREGNICATTGHYTYHGITWMIKKYTLLVDGLRCRGCEVYSGPLKEL